MERYRDGKEGMRVESGTVYFSRPGRMRWEYHSPQEKLFLVDGKNVWFYVPADRTASRAAVKQSDDWRTPLALLAGKARLSRLCGGLSLVSPEAAKFQDIPQENSTLEENSILSCTPKGKAEEASFREIFFEVDPQNRLARVLIREPGGVEEEFRFGNWKENLPVLESKFHFEPPLGVAIVNESQLLGTKP